MPARRRAYCAGDERAARCSPHEGVNVTVEVHIGGVSAAGRQSAADESRHYQPQGGPPAGGHHHGGHRGDQEQLDNPGLGKGDQGPDAGEHTGDKARLATAERAPASPATFDMLGRDDDGQSRLVDATSLWS